jgi:hypothetical protein
MKISSQFYFRIPLSIFMAVSVYSVVPLSHWVWLHGGVFNDVVQVQYLISNLNKIFECNKVPMKKNIRKTVNNTLIKW